LTKLSFSLFQPNYRPQNNQVAPTQNKQQQNGQQQQQNRGGKPLKFENEFDFEQANSKFEELRTKLQRLKVGSEETKSTDQVNQTLLFYCLLFGDFLYPFLTFLKTKLGNPNFLLSLIFWDCKTGWVMIAFTHEYFCFLGERRS
jgi:hypothetical protein